MRDLYGKALRCDPLWACIPCARAHWCINKLNPKYDVTREVLDHVKYLKQNNWPLYCEKIRGIRVEENRTDPSGAFKEGLHTRQVPRQALQKWTADIKRTLELKASLGTKCYTKKKWISKRLASKDIAESKAISQWDELEQKALQNLVPFCRDDDLELMLPMYMGLQTHLSVSTASSQGLQGSADITSHEDHKEQLSRVMGSTALGSESVNSFKNLLSAGPHQGLAKKMFETEDGPLRRAEGPSAFEGHLAIPAPPVDPPPKPKRAAKKAAEKLGMALDNEFFKMEADFITDVLDF